MNRIYITDVELIDQDGNINRAEIDVLEGDDKPDNLLVVRNLVTIAMVEEEALNIEFYQEETGISLLKEIGVSELEEGLDSVNLLTVGQEYLRKIIAEVTDKNTVIISSMFEDVTLEEGKEYFLQSIVFADCEEDYKKLAEAVRGEEQESGTVKFDIGQIVESFNVNKVVENVKLHMRENNNPTKLSDLQLEHTVVNAIYQTIGSVKYADMVRIHKEKESLKADFPDVPVVEETQVAE